MIVSYSYIFQIGQNEHRVKIYENYTKEKGLHGDLVFGMMNSRKDRIFKKLKRDVELTDKQWEVLKQLAKEKVQHMVILPDGSCRSY